MEYRQRFRGRACRLLVTTLAIAGATALPAQASVSIPAASCLELDATAQALVDLHNLGPANPASELRNRWSTLQGLQNALAANPAIKNLAAMPQVGSSWRALESTYQSLPADSALESMHQRLLAPMQAYRQALNALITSITSCQP